MPLLPRRPPARVHRCQCTHAHEQTATDMNMPFTRLPQKAPLCMRGHTHQAAPTAGRQAVLRCGYGLGIADYRPGLRTQQDSDRADPASHRGTRTRSSRTRHLRGNGTQD